MQRKWIAPLAVLALLLFLVLPFLGAQADPHSVYLDRKPLAPAFYGLMLAASVAMLVGYAVFARRKYIWVLLNFVAVAIVNTGYLALSLAGNAAEALLANRIAYFGNVYMLLFLMITLANACGIRYGRGLVAFLFAVSTVMFLFAGTQGYLDLFYRNVDFAIVDGYARIIKDYGPMHTMYIVYIFSYLALMVGTVVYALRRRAVRSLSHAVLIFCIGLINVAIWFAEQFLPHTIEFLSGSYVLNGALLLWIYRQLVREGALDTFTVTMHFRTEDQAEKVVAITMENRNPDEVLPQCHTAELARLTPEQLRQIIDRMPAENRLTQRETEVAVLLLQDLKRKEIASSLCVSEETVKTHTAHIYGKLNVSNRRVLAERAGELARQQEE